METQTVNQLTVTGQINLALTKQSLSVQKLQDEADSLVFNEDELENISAFLSKIKKIDKVTEDAHKIIKAPFLEQGKACDAAKNSILAITDSVRKPVQEKYNKICAEVEARKQAQAREKARIDSITNGIEANVLGFSNQIASCTTNAELLEVERRINLEKSPSGKKKYEEFHEQAIARFDEVLLPIIKQQKEQVKKGKLLQNRFLMLKKTMMF